MDQIEREVQKTITLIRNMKVAGMQSAKSAKIGLLLHKAGQSYENRDFHTAKEILKRLIDEL